MKTLERHKNSVRAVCLRWKLSFFLQFHLVGILQRHQIFQITFIIFGFTLLYFYICRYMMTLSCLLYLYLSTEELFSLRNSQAPDGLVGQPRQNGASLGSQHGHCSEVRSNIVDFIDQDQDFNIGTALYSLPYNCSRKKSVYMTIITSPKYLKTISNRNVECFHQNQIQP